jgi:hypothetical protein
MNLNCKHFNETQTNYLLLQLATNEENHDHQYMHIKIILLHTLQQES